MKKIWKALICATLALLMITACACNQVEPGAETEAETEAPEAETAAPELVNAVVLKTGKMKNEFISSSDVEVVEVDKSLLPEDYISKKTEVIGKWAADILLKDTYLGKSMILKEAPTTEDVSLSVSELGYLVITDYVPVNSGRDVSADIQKVIDTNPNRTIFFPDGEYILANPIATSANPVHSVSLHLSNYAVLKAADGWNHTEALVRMGGAEPFNDITTNGSNYYFYGGIIDGNGVANGISIDSGRETSIRNVSIKHTQIGLHVKTGANSKSSDADIDTVNIVGNNKKGSIGVLCVGYDNTFTNMRIYKVQTGVRLEGAGNFLRNLHPLLGYGGMEFDYVDSIGFDDASGGNWYDFCYSDQFATGFRMKNTTLSTYQTCFCFWYKSDVMQVGFKSVDGNGNPSTMKSTIWNTKVVLNSASVAEGIEVPEGTKIVRGYLLAKNGGSGRIECAIFSTGTDNIKTIYGSSYGYSGYMKDNAVSP